MSTFAVGDVVVDCEDEEAARLVVLDPDRGVAEEVVIESLDATVAAVNTSYPPDDVVVSCVHVDWLDRNVGDEWTEWSDGRFRERLESFAGEWNLRIASYAYPAGRLRPVDGASGEGQSSLDAWGS